MRIVVRCHGAQAAQAAQAKLAAAGVEAAAFPGVAKPRRAAPQGEDILIVDASDGLAAAAPFAAAAAEAEQRPLLVLAGLPSQAPLPAGLGAVPGLDGAVALDAPPKLLAGQVGAYLRTAVAEEERRRRLATAQIVGAATPKPSEPRRLKALYIGAPSAMFLSLERAFSPHGGMVAAAFTSFSGFDHLHDEFFDAVVLNGAQDPGTAISLCAALRRNASLHHLPTLLVTAAGDASVEKAAIDRGASCVAALNAPAGPALGWLFEAIRRERRRKAAEHDIRALRDLMGDPRTGLFRRAAFEAHLGRMAEDHHASGRPMSLAALRVLPAHGAREPSDQVWRRGFTEIASLAGRLVRDSDSGAAIGRNLIVLALPATDLAGARRSAERVASVAECTAFASGEGGAGPLVFEQSVVELQPGESGAGLFARAAGVFQVTSVSA